MLCSLVQRCCNNAAVFNHECYSNKLVNSRTKELKNLKTKELKNLKT